MKILSRARAPPEEKIAVIFIAKRDDEKSTDAFISSIRNASSGKARQTPRRSKSHNHAFLKPVVDLCGPFASPVEESKGKSKIKTRTHSIHEISKEGKREYRTSSNRITSRMKSFQAMSKERKSSSLDSKGKRRGSSSPRSSASWKDEDDGHISDSDGSIGYLKNPNIEDDSRGSSRSSLLDRGLFALEKLYEGCNK